MTSESGLLGLYWGAREEPIEQCARRAYETLCTLESLGYERYFFLGRSRRDALKRRFEVTQTNVLATLAKGVNRSDIPRKPIPELGWRMHLWSGDADNECYSLSIACGAYSEYVSNSVVLKLPADGRLSISASPPRALKAYEALVMIWDPEQAVLCEGSINWDAGRLVPEREPLALYPRRSR